jgi:hypothetical protein
VIAARRSSALVLRDPPLVAVQPLHVRARYRGDQRHGLTRHDARLLVTTLSTVFQCCTRHAACSSPRMFVADRQT